MSRAGWKRWWAGCGLALLPATAWGGASPTAEQALQLTPVQAADIEVDRPAEDALAQCTIKAEKVGEHTGWVVYDANSQVLRKFVDTDGNNVVDVWSYYRDGLEVYRDIDSNHDSKADQFRWLNIAGSRWGIDTDQDGKIDSWKRISAEEVSAEVVLALAHGDAARFARVLITNEELTALGLGEAKQKEASELLLAAPTDFKVLAGKQRVLANDAEWVDFGATRPGLSPSGADGSTKDVEVYENVLAMVESGDKNVEVQVGTLVRVGDLWRAIQAPVIVAGDQVAGDGGLFFRVRPTENMNVQEGAEGNTTGAEAERIQKLWADLEAIDKEAEAAKTPEAFAQASDRRVTLFEQLIDGAQAGEDRAQWVRQLADSLSVAVQSGNYPAGAERLKSLHEKLAGQEGDAELAAYVEFRHLAADYGLQLVQPNADFPKVQEAWLASLKKFVEAHPTSADAAEAMLQLGMAEELAGQEDAAKQWYSQLAQAFPESPAAKKAQGAKGRLDSVGKVLNLRGKNPAGGTVDLTSKQFRGKLVLVHFWATWCEPCKADMALLKELHAKYGAKGFALLGVSLDNSAEEAVSYLKENHIPWAQIYEPGGLESSPANELGILTLPTMLLLDAEGKVVARNLHVTELDKELSTRLR